MGITPANTCDSRKHGPTDDNDTNCHQRKMQKRETTSPPETSFSSSSRTRQTCSVNAAGPHGNLAVEGSSNSSTNGDTNKNKRLSILESLPAELIEKIFLFSLNVNLPRASPFLAAVLSNERVYRLLVLLAFWHDKDSDKHQPEFFSEALDESFSEEFDGHTPSRATRSDEDISQFMWEEQPTFSIPRILRPLGHDYVPLEDLEREALQWSILQCSWCTDDRIRKQYPDLARLVITQRCVNAGYLPVEEERGQKMEELLRFGGVGIFKRIRKGPEQERKVDSYCRVHVTRGEYLEIRYYNSDRSFDTVPLLGLVMRLPPFLLCADNNKTNHKGRATGYFTDAHFRLLGTILHSGGLSSDYRVADLDPEFHPRGALLQGAQTAITTTNPRVLDILLQFDTSIHLELDTYYHFPSDLFRNAAQVYLNIDSKHGDYNEDTKDADKNKARAKDDALLCFILLLTTSAESVPYEDPVITQFAKSVGGAFGSWMLEFIEGLPEHIKTVRETYRNADDIGFLECFDNNLLFNARLPVLSEPMGNSYFRQVMPTSEIFEVPTRWLRTKPSYIYE